MPEHSHDELLSINEAAEFLTITRPTLYRWLREGRVQGMKVGRQWRFKRADLKRFLDGREAKVDLPADLNPFLSDLRGTLHDPPPLSGDSLQDAFALMVRTLVEREAESLHLATFQEEDGPGRVSCLRVRADGVLGPLAALDPRLVAPLIRSWKETACCDPRETGVPQDGRILVETGGRQVDLRVAFLPSVMGESMLVRLVGGGRTHLKLSGLGMSENDQARLEEGLNRRSRLVVIAGSAGSALDTVLCAGLREIAGPDKNLIAVEGPAWQVIPWSTPVSLHSMGGSRSYSAAVRAVMRSDPDIIGVRLLPDPESVRAAQEAALKGALVVAGFPADGAVDALRRLIALSDNPLALYQTLDLIYSQVLVRKLCPDCEQPGAGCKKCSGVGYRGRTLVGESLRFTRAILELLQAGASDQELLQQACREGTVSIRSRLEELVRQGITSPEEAYRQILSQG